MNTSLEALLRDPAFKEGEVWQRRQVAAKGVVFAEGDPGHEVFFVLAGAVRVIGHVDLEGDRQVQPGFSDLGPGEVFGELALLDGQPRSATVMAISDCELAVIPGDKLMAFLDQHPEVGYQLFKELAMALVERLRLANRRVFSLFAWGLKARGIDPHL